MNALRRCDEWSDREAQLADEVDELREEVRQLKKLFTGSDCKPPRGLRLSPQEDCMLQLFVRRRELVTRDQLMFAMYADRTIDDWPGGNSVDVYVCKLRRRLRAAGAVIETVWGRGWLMPEASRLLLLAMPT